VRRRDADQLSTTRQFALSPHRFEIDPDLESKTGLHLQWYVHELLHIEAK
jgi:hypothetical protein